MQRVTFCTFFYVFRFDERRECKLRVRSMVGLIPLYACLVINDEYVDKLPGFKKRMDWFLKHREDLRNEVRRMKNVWFHIIRL